MSIPKTAFVAATTIVAYAVVSDDQKSRVNSSGMSARQLVTASVCQAKVYLGSSLFHLALSQPRLFVNLKNQAARNTWTNDKWFHFEQFLYSTEACRVLWRLYPSTFPGMTRTIYLNSRSERILNVQPSDSVCPLHMINEVQPNLRNYIIGIAALKDKYAAVINGTSEQASAFMELVADKQFRRNAVQDIRNGRLFDRRKNCPIDPLLRLDLEKVIFRGFPDPHRSLEISDSRDILPRLTVIIDEENSRSDEKKFPGFPVVHPFRKDGVAITAVWQNHTDFTSLPRYYFQVPISRFS